MIAQSFDFGLLLNYMNKKWSFWQRKALEILRWVTVIGFFFLALTKTILLLKYGLEPYHVVVRTTGLPGVVGYYGIVAVVVEFYLAVGLWIERQYIKAIIMAALLTTGGIGLSVFFIVFKIQSDCGCGLLGDGEWGLLFQKVAIIIVLIILSRKKKLLKF